jgi:CheY-like chemotaxis protein
MAHLLLIDDDPALTPGQVRQAFPAPAHRVEVAATGAEGLERIRAGPPDVVLLDLRLPDQSGLEVYQQIRGLDARILVIFVTVAKGADTAIEAMKQGPTTHDAGRLGAECRRFPRPVGNPGTVPHQGLGPARDCALVARIGLAGEPAKGAGPLSVRVRAGLATAVVPVNKKRSPVPSKKRSPPLKDMLKKFGFTSEHVVAAARERLRLPSR